MPIMANHDAADNPALDIDADQNIRTCFGEGKAKVQSRIIVTRHPGDGAASGN